MQVELPSGYPIRFVSLNPARPTKQFRGTLSSSWTHSLGKKTGQTDIYLNLAQPESLHIAFEDLVSSARAEIRLRILNCIAEME